MSSRRSRKRLPIFDYEDSQEDNLGDAVSTFYGGRKQSSSLFPKPSSKPGDTSMRMRTVLEQMIFSGKIPDTGGNAQEPPAVHSNNITGDPSHSSSLSEDISSSSDSQLEGDMGDDTDLLLDSD